MDEPDLLYMYLNTTVASGRPRLILLENYPAILHRDWLPSEEEWPEFADLRAEHERLLDGCEDALLAASEANAEFAAERKAQHAEMEAALRENREEEQMSLTPPEEQKIAQDENIRRIEASFRVLVDFLEDAFKQIRELAPELYDGLAAEERVADAKRAEAQGLLNEADAVVRNVQRKQMWLGRECRPTLDEITGDPTYQRRHAAVPVRGHGGSAASREHRPNRSARRRLRDSCRPRLKGGEMGRKMGKDPAPVASSDVRAKRAIRATSTAS
jgi:hypothetical protein